MGALHESKRIDFLIQAVKEARKLDPSFRLIVGGSGPEGWRIGQAAQGSIVHIPRLRDEELVDAANQCNAIWMPGRIGLVAVDALALGLPIATTAYQWHAPEFEYLQREVDFHVLSDNPVDFARQALGLRPVPFSQRPWERIPTIESVVDNFARAIQEVLTDSRP